MVTTTLVIIAILLAVAIGGWSGQLKDITGGALDGAKTAVTIAIAMTM